MGETHNRNRMIAINNFVYGFVLPYLIILSPFEIEQVFQIIERERKLNFLIKNPKTESFKELVKLAKRNRLIDRPLAPEEFEYFPQTTTIKKGYIIRLFPFFPGEEHRATKIMKSLGYKHGNGCELMNFVLSKKCSIEDQCMIIAKGSKSKPDKKEGFIFPALFIGGKNTASLSIHDLGIYPSMPLYYLGVHPRKIKK